MIDYVPPKPHIFANHQLMIKYEESADNPRSPPDFNEIASGHEFTTSQKDAFFFENNKLAQSKSGHGDTACFLGGQTKSTGSPKSRLAPMPPNFDQSSTSQLSKNDVRSKTIEEKFGLRSKQVSKGLVGYVQARPFSQQAVNRLMRRKKSPTEIYKPILKET